MKYRRLVTVASSSFQLATVQGHGSVFQGHFFTTSYEKIFLENTTIFSNFSDKTWKSTATARSKKDIN